MNALISTTRAIRKVTGRSLRQMADLLLTRQNVMPSEQHGSRLNPVDRNLIHGRGGCRAPAVIAALVLALGTGLPDRNSLVFAQPPGPAYRPAPGAGMTPVRRPMGAIPIGAAPAGAVPPGTPIRPSGPVPPAAPELSTHQRLVQLASGHPVCIVIGEGLASEFVGTVREEEGPFQDFVMGAQVRGMQKTKAHTALDFTPHNDVAKMLFVLKGVTENDTVAQLPQAAVRSAGTFEFEMTKQIEFNGRDLRTWSPSAFMTIHQKNLGAATAVSNIPLLGPLANNIVLNVADQRKPISEGLAAQRVTQKVAPEFNSNLDKVLAKLNDQLHGPLNNKMVAAGMLPSRISTSTTQDAMLCGLEFQPALAEAADASGRQPLKPGNRTPTVLVTRQLIPGAGPRYGADPELTAPTPYSLDSTTLRDRACLLVHASLVENLVDRFHLAGREITDTQLANWLGTASAETEGDAPQLYTLILAKESPLFVIMDDGELFLEIRVAIRPVIGPELPVQVIQISIRPELTADQIRIKPVIQSVQPLEPGERGQAPSPLTAMIRQVLEQRLQERSFPRTYEISRQQGRESFPVKIQSLTLVEGWLTATLETAPASSPVPSAKGSKTVDVQ